MSPEKVAVLLVTALITALLATALLNAEKSEAAPRMEAAKAAAGGGTPPPARRPDPLDDLTYDDLRSGRFRPAPIARPESATDTTPTGPSTVDYVVRRGDTARVIARRELGGERHLASIARLNPDVDLNKLKVGQTLKLPAPKAKTVLKTSGKGGETTPAPGPTPGKNSAVKSPAKSPSKTPAKSPAKSDPKSSAAKKPAATDPKKTKGASNPGAAVKPRTV